MTTKKKADKSISRATPVPQPSLPCRNIVEATASYEQWLSQQTNVVQADIDYKHHQMTVNPFILLRATFYRFADLWHMIAKDVADAPVVLAVGDLHIENFGTWRDSEGRLIWGVSDFDEVCYAPFTVDLVRLATSALLAARDSNIIITPDRACEAILKGYKDSLKARGEAFVLAEDHGWLRDVAVASLKKPTVFWQHLTSLPIQQTALPASAQECLERLLPDRTVSYFMVKRVAGEGSLGRPRYTAIAPWRGGFVARDVKAMLPSAWQWARNHSGPFEILYAVAVGRAVRCQDPLVHSTGQWIGRRLAPDCTRIELVKIERVEDEARLLYAMGWETANIHLGSQLAINAVKSHLKKLNKDWLCEAASAFVNAVDLDFQKWKEHMETQAAHA
jgi:hypothetical protein